MQKNIEQFCNKYLHRFIWILLGNDIWYTDKAPSCFRRILQETLCLHWFKNTSFRLHIIRVPFEPSCDYTVKIGHRYELYARLKNVDEMFRANIINGFNKVLLIQPSVTVPRSLLIFTEKLWFLTFVPTRPIPVI